MPKEILFLVEESMDGGYEAQAPGYSIYTQADTLDEVRRMTVDAVRCRFDEGDLPRIIRLHLVREEVIAV
ncbi:MAG: 2-oxoisovalerate dehydrogenase [Dehalococcoidia bacterium]|nr:2-oxoisovalerate dehydrogenase [Dehalococcoidia bacterium]